MCKYDLAAQAHYNIYKKEIKPEAIKKDVKEIIKKHNGLINESSAFVMWLDELKLRGEFKKLKNNGEVRSMDFVEKNLGMPDIMEIYGETRSLKTFTAYKFAVERAKSGKKVIYIDTERNMTKEQIKELNDAGCDYRCIINFDRLVNFITSKLPKGYNYLILDSVGLPALGKFAVSSMHGKGQVLLNVQAILYTLKDYCVENDCYAVVTNQPTSEMNKTEHFTYNGKKYIELTPFGDKGSFFVKEIYRAIPVKRTQNETVVDLIAWGSRVYPKYKPVVRLVRKGTNLEVKAL
ncbi:hypothetical protein [Methanothermococcus okinawensis]|uniref:Uncharacterized protein n=1 Tax=Methanothermococcus okinawensis (strain DSM 14208 / JCM 11175 / IH1) TaxID=647113 RepID=F8ANU1_METOI|nr:hypothetical protein [Methanothermococcus okinawensis]AEH06294.1 hypothetical protein Metok_0304 [Methanothermococcus okinawensis IH1]